MEENNVQTIIRDVTPTSTQTSTEGTREGAETDVKQKQQEIDLEKEFKKAMDEEEDTDDSQESLKNNWHDRSNDSIPISALLDRSKKKRFITPDFQRLYVWNEEQREKLVFEALLTNNDCGNICLCECKEDGKLYLTDGVQRITSFGLILSNYDELNLDEKQIQRIKDYRITVTTMFDMTMEEIKAYFRNKNSGTVLPPILKEMAKLPKDLHNAVLYVSNNEIFRRVNIKQQFIKSHNHYNIAMNALLSAAGCPVDEGKAKSMCTRLVTYSEGVMTGIDAAKSFIERIAEIYDNLSDDIFTVAMNANFVSSLAYVMMKNPQYSNTNIAELINYIYQKKTGVAEYRETTRSGAGDTGNCKKRDILLVNFLNNPVIKSLDEKAFQTFAKEQRDNMLKDTTTAYGVAFEDFDEAEQKALYMAQRDGKSVLWNTLVEKKYKQLEQQEPKKDKRESA